jgi:CHAT domain-containing protein
VGLVSASLLFLNNEFISYLLKDVLGNIFALAFLGYLGFHLMLIIVNIVICIILPLIIVFAISIIKRKNHRMATYFIWLYIQIVSIFVKKISPYFIVSSFSDLIYIGFIQIAFFYILQIDSTPQTAEARKFATQFTQNIIKNKSFLFNINKKTKYQFAVNVAAKLLLFGDLRQADILYTDIWNSAKLNKAFVSSLDEPCKEICYYYIQTYQYELLESLIQELEALVDEKKILKLTYYSNLMRSAFAMNVYSTQTIDCVYTWLKWENIINILLGLPDFGESNILVGNSPKALFKIFLNTNLKDKEYSEKFIKANSQNLALLLSTFQSIFNSQDKIYLFLSTRDSQWLPNDREITLALTRTFSLNILGIEISFDNPFFRDNTKLISLVYLLVKDTVSTQALNTELDKMRQSAKEQGRQIDLALIKCCEGKLLIKSGTVKKGLKTLLEGIKLYEGIRYSISTDQLGVGFGSSYLEYYGWIIDALLQMGYPSLAFDGVERSTARALLDLVSRRTYRSCSQESSNAVAKLIGEIQDIDFNIYFLQSQPYEAPLFSKYLPPLLKNQLKLLFDKNKADRLNILRKQRDSLIANLDPESSALVKLQPLTWGTFSEDGESFIRFEALWNSEAVAQKEVILSFHVIHKINFAGKSKEWEKIFCFALYHQGSHYHHHLIDDPQTVAELQQECQIVLTKRINDRKNPSRLNRSLSHISNHLLIPLLTNLPSNSNALIISANSDLQFFPWSALYYQDEPDANKRLIDKFTIRTTPSLSLLYLLNLRENSRPLTPTKFLVAGIQNYPPPQTSLFWSGVEIERISQLYPSNSVRQLKDVEVDEHFANEFKKAEVIHYSGHGYYDSKLDSEKEALEKTYLCLYNQNISAAQILDGALENPTAKVMILSACLTGTGDLTTSGSEILGLERALFHAGLSSLITTLWSVGDFPTALLMLKLHSVWRSHNNTVNTLASSLREAQLWLKNSTWKQLKQEFPQIEQDVKKGMEVYTNLIRDAEANQNNKTADKLKAEYSYYEYVSDELKSESTNAPFRHPYYWAAFQVKGMG